MLMVCFGQIKNNSIRIKNGNKTTEGRRSFDRRDSWGHWLVRAGYVNEGIKFDVRLKFVFFELCIENEGNTSNWIRR